MARPRIELHEILLGVLDSGNVYFQPPVNQQIEYPCIVYKRDDEDVRFANNRPYARTRRYEVKVIDQKPDSPISAQIAELPMCVFDRSYPAANLNHDVYKLFF